MTKAIFILSVTLTLAGVVEAATLSEETAQAFEHYVALTEARIDAELREGPGFLVIDSLPKGETEVAYRRLRAGEIVKRRLTTLGDDGSTVDVPKGLVHHWIGSIFVPGTSVEELVPWLTDYDAHQRYFDEVEASRLVSRHGDTFEIYLRLRRKKIITVHYNTEHRVVYRHHGAGRVTSRSHATRIAEIENVGTPEEKEKPVGDDRGFLWRLNSYWRFKDVDGGVIVECESVSLSRSIPAALRWIVGRYIDSVPRESLDATLAPIRDSYGAGVKTTFVQPSSLPSKIR